LSTLPQLDEHIGRRYPFRLDMTPNVHFGLAKLLILSKSFVVVDPEEDFGSQRRCRENERLVPGEGLD